MKLDSITLKNFRCYEDLTVGLHPQLTVLVANNGGGKTTLLDALRIGLWPFVGSFDLARSKFADPANAIALDDVRLLSIEREMARQLPVNVVLTADYGLGQKKWMRYRDSEAAGTHTKEDQETRDLKLFAADLQVRVRDIEQVPVDLPVFGYYGTGRLYNEKRLTKNKTQASQGEVVSQGIRTFGYLDCLDPASSYKQFEAWFISAFLKVRESQIRQLEKRDVVEDIDPDILGPVKVVQNVVDTVLNTTGWHKLEYSETYEKSLVLYHEQQGVLKVNQLSDGIKNMLAMVADIAYRCALLNRHMGVNAALRSRGVVMIDEVDMHLHPDWQQTVISSLLKAFPNIQFIVTTHSPQVITTVPDDCIRILKDGDVYPAPKGTKGAESSRVLKRVFDVNVRPKDDENTKLLNDYLDMVYADRWVEDPNVVSEARSELDAIFVGEEPALTEADLYIENRKWELELEKDQ
ncbi:MAG: AAA family ATPase [Thiothrix litoralis]|uniref:AAA family ATPase n=1 Tax=Thiothrix litoralis TaxID=2891210 RepID=UPI003C72D2F9